MVHLELQYNCSLRSTQGLARAPNLGRLCLAQATLLSSIEELGACRELRYVDLDGCSALTGIYPLASCEQLEECHGKGLTSCQDLERMG